MPPLRTHRSDSAKNLARGTGGLIFGVCKVFSRAGSRHMLQ